MTRQPQLGDFLVATITVLPTWLPLPGHSNASDALAPSLDWSIYSAMIVRVGCLVGHFIYCILVDTCNRHQREAICLHQVLQVIYSQVSSTLHAWVIELTLLGTSWPVMNVCGIAHPLPRLATPHPHRPPTRS